CGDCSLASNCLSVVPVETEFGRKRAIDQSSCNKDFSCLNGFCPSFVTVEGGRFRRQPAAIGMPSVPLREPDRPSVPDVYNVLIAGVGGTGIITIGALLGMAAHLEGRSCSVLDMTGMAQKGGAVVTHVRIGPPGQTPPSAKVPQAGADLVLGCDLLVAAQPETLAVIAPGRSHVVLNTHETVTGAFTRDPDAAQPTKLLLELVRAAADGRVDALDATAMATRLVGDGIATNLFMLGYAYQQGRIPMSAAAIDRAIELNGVAVETNRLAFRWGRLAAAAPAEIDRTLAGDGPHAPLATTLEDIVARRVEYLTRYQDARYAERYRALVMRVAAKEAAILPQRRELSTAVARGLFKLMAYKDEYEVARLYTETPFLDDLRRHFDGDVRFTFHLAPPLLAARDPATGETRKRAFGPWMLRVFRVLAKFKVLRGTRFDPFGYTAERRLERRLVAEYAALIKRLVTGLTAANYDVAVDLARLPETMRGFGHVKKRNVAKAKAREAELLALWIAGDTTPGGEAAPTHKRPAAASAA
ncbi:MAG TPA: DUF6537 domain-containing protein, partial [Alphaproteobacteria bacterium]